jgi:hypothetical protein
MEDFLMRKPLHKDVRRGCKAIADYLHGDPAMWRKVNHLVHTGRFPYYREGNIICARESTIDRWIALQEQYAMEGKVWGLEDVKKHFDHEDD